MAEQLNPDPQACPDAFDVDGLAIPGGVRPIVWLAPPAGDALSPQLARRLLDEHTRHGDVIVDIDDDVALAVAAAETGRRHHALGGAHRLAALGDTAGYVDLVLLRWPQPKSANPRWLLMACHSLLRHGSGVLVVAVSVPAGQRISHLAALTGAARAVGLRHLYHVATVDPAGLATTRRQCDAGSADAATPGLDGDVTERPSGHTHRDAVAGFGHVAPHTDLLVFVSEDDRHE